MYTVYGYARVSTLRQKLNRQVDNIKEVNPDAIMVTEKFSGTTTDRPAFKKLLAKVKEGDTIIFDSVSRMSRTAEEGYQLYMDLYSKGVNLVFIKEPTINTSVYRETAQLAMTGTELDYVLEGINKYLMVCAEKQIHIAFDQSEKEVQDLHKRISEGLHQAKLRGSQVGRKTGRKYVSKKSVEMKAKIRKMSKDFDGGMNDTEIIETIRIARNTFYRYKREMIQSQED